MQNRKGKKMTNTKIRSRRKFTAEFLKKAVAISKEERKRMVPKDEKLSIRHQTSAEADGAGPVEDTVPETPHDSRRQEGIQVPIPAERPQQRPRQPVHLDRLCGAVGRQRHRNQHGQPCPCPGRILQLLQRREASPEPWIQDTRKKTPLILIAIGSLMMAISFLVFCR